MKTIFQTTYAVFAAVTLLALTGCSSLQPQTADTQVTGIMCDKCESVWFPKIGPAGKPGGGHVIYRASRRMVCPQCENIVATFFRTGRLTHVCPGCRGNMTRCTAQMAAQQASGGRSAM